MAEDAFKQITSLKMKQEFMRESMMNKLQLLTILPNTDLGKASIRLDERLLDKILSENAELSHRVTLLRAEYQLITQSSNHNTNGERKKEVLMERRIPLQEYPNDNGIILNTHEYVDLVNTDGSKPFSKQDLDLHNFQVLFRKFLNIIMLPCIESLGPMTNWKIVPLSSTQVLASMAGPEESSLEDETYGVLASCKVISLYPACRGRPSREGDPICDRYTVKLLPNAAIICLTDGCNWGEKPRRASRVANAAMVEFVRKNLSSIKTIWDAVHTLIGSLADAQLAIVNGPDEKWAGGKTTANIGVMLEVDQRWVESKVMEEVNDIMNEDFVRTIVPTRWAFVTVNIGDCKVLHISRNKVVTDITDVNRSDYLDPTDPGGRLGPYQGVWPDLRNLAAFWTTVEEGDIIASMSDGVHDNLDPQIQGLSPSDFGYPQENWEDLPPRVVVAIKTAYLRYFTQYLIRNVEILTPKAIKDLIMDHCVKTSARAREFLETNPQEKTPSSYKEYPGKLDHSSIACLRVGSMGNKDINPSASNQEFISLVNTDSPSTCILNQFNSDDTLSVVIERVKNYVASLDLISSEKKEIPTYAEVLQRKTEQSSSSFRKRVRSNATRGDITSLTGRALRKFTPIRRSQDGSAN